MKKYIALGILLLTFPLLANASWWNPISWFSFLTPKTQIVEKIVYVPATTTPITKPEVTPQSEASIVKTTVKTKATVNIPAPTPVSIPVQTVAPTVTPVDLGQATKDLIAKYISFKNLVQDEISSNGYANVNSFNGQEYVKASTLSDMIPKLNSDIYDLSSGNYSQKNIDYYTGIFNDFQTQYKSLGIVDNSSSTADDAAYIESLREQGAIQQAADRQSKLDAINLQIANLNAKYAKDSNAIINGAGGSVEGANTALNDITIQYQADYNTLMAEFQQVKYSN